MPTGNNTMCQSMKAAVLLLLLLHCSSGITITPISFIVSSALTATFVFSWSPTVLSAETSISVTATFSDTELNSIPIVVLTTSATVTTSSVMFPISSSSVVDPTEIIMFPTDIVTETILSTTSLGTEIVPITATGTSVVTTPVISTNTTTLLSTTSLSSVDGITMILTSPPVLTTFLSQTTFILQTTLGSLQSLTPTVTTVLTSLMPTPTPTLVPINLVVVVIRFSVSSIAKRDTSNYTDIKSEIANVTGISAERINIVSLRREDTETIVINATIVELNSTEFITLHTAINSGMISITYEGMAYSSLSIELQPQQECSEYDERNYDCDALEELRPCPSNMMCQGVLNNTSQFCVPCQCNLIPDDASCRDNCISNVCVPLSDSGDDDDDDDGGLSDRAIVGIVVGITVPLVLISIFVGIFIQRRRKSRGRYTPKKISMKKANTYDSIARCAQPPQWDSTIYRNTNEMITLSERLTEEKDNDGDKIQEYTMFTDL